MKLLRYVLVFTGCCLSMANAQKDCRAITTEIHRLTSEKKFAEVQAFWKSSADCKTANDTIFSDWEKVLKYEISHSKEAEQQENIDRLFSLYKSYDVRYPSNDKNLIVRKALLLNSLKLATPDEIYNLLDTTFKNPNTANFDPTALYLYFDLYFNQFKAGTFKEQDVFGKRDAVLSRINKLVQTNPSEARSYQSTASGIKALVAPIVTCEKLLSYYKSIFDSRKSDATWLENTAEGLKASNCVRDPFFLSLSVTLNEIEKSSNSAYNLGMALVQNGNTAKGIEYYNLAAEQQSDAKQKAQIYYTIATVVGTDKSLALQYLKKAITANPSFGKAYLLMAHLFADSPDCGISPFEKKAIYLLAAEFAQKALENDPSVKAAATQQKAQFLEKAPSKSEIKSEKMAGKKVTFACWMNESVIVPKS